MSLLIFKEDERGDIFPYRAVCIELEIDVYDDSEIEVWHKLEKSLL